SPPPTRQHARAQLRIVRLGRQPYARTLELQREVARARINGSITEDVLLLVEHPPVVTLGRSAKDAHLMASRELLAARGVELFEVERGGDVTFHGPGQLVGYPVLDLKRHRQDLHWYLRQVEESLIRAMAPFDVRCTRNAGFTGVWVESDAAGVPHAPRKLASIGVHARNWVTWHGFALNVHTDLSYFDLMVPCGIDGVTMTSVAVESGDGAPSFAAVADAVALGVAEVFELDAVGMELDELMPELVLGD
ncbi:MAG: lipoyl(octanoyl) transferase LipB, partial [Gemmatimonadaceae bacterium]